MQNIKNAFIILGIVIITGFSIIYFSYNYNISDTITGNAVAQGGQTAALGLQKSANPSEGALKGAFQYTILDNGAEIDSIPAAAPLSRIVY